MFGFGKRKRQCKECGAELGEMEALADRADDLMRGSAYAAEPTANICARCRVSFSRGAKSMTASLHEIEARRIEAEEAKELADEWEEEEVVVEPQPFADAEVAAQEPQHYSHGGGYKTAEDLELERLSEYEKIREINPQSDFASVLDWLVSNKLGQFILGFGFFVLISIFNMFDDPEPAYETPVYEQAEPSYNPPPPASSAPVDAVSAAVPAGNPSSWVNTNDYPSRALRDEREGTTAFRLTINAEGRVAECLVTTSSGHRDLDSATCAALTKRARFEPALDATGTAIIGSWASRVRWQIPK
jgi:TonB family protein